MYCTGGYVDSWSTRARLVSATTAPATETTTRWGLATTVIGWSGPGSRIGFSSMVGRTNWHAVHSGSPFRLCLLSANELELDMAKTLDDVAAIGAREQGLAVVSTLRTSGTIQSSLVNVGVLAHPSTG